MSLLNKIIDKFTLKSYSIEALIQNNQIILKGYRNKILFSVKQMIALYSALKPIVNLCIFHENDTVTVEIDHLNELRKFFNHTQEVKLEFFLSQELEEIVFSDINEIKIQYVYDSLSKQLNRILPKGSVIWSNQWLRFNNKFYYLGKDFSFGICKDYFCSNEVLVFLQNDLPIFKNVVECEISLSEENILNITLSAISDEKLNLKCNYLYPTYEFEYIDGLEDYILYNKKIYKTFHPKKLASILGAEIGFITYENEEIPYFIENKYPLIKKWILDGVNIVQNYKIHSKNIKAVLLASVDDTNIVGKPYAEPCVQINGIFKNAFELSKLIKKNTKYINIGINEWVSVEALTNIGIAMGGRQVDGSPLWEPYLLNPSEVIYRGSERLEGIWHSLIFDELCWPTNVDNTELVLNHFEFLRKHGISGGAICDFIDNYMPVKKFLANLLKQYNEAKILIIAKKSEYDILVEEYIDYVPVLIETTKKSELYPKDSVGTYIISPTLIEKCSNILSTQWEIIIFIAFEELYKTSTSKAYEAAYSLKSKLRLNLTTFPSMKTMTSNQYDALYKMLRCLGDSHIHKYTIRKVNDSIILPTPYEFKVPKFRGNGLKTTEIILEDIPEKGIAIPPRQNLHNHGEMQVSVSYSTREDSFLSEAKKFENYTVLQAEYIDFMTYWPTYSSMSKQQHDWYFYWRNEVRSNNFKRTDLSYIFIYIYELINRIGWRDPDDGFGKIISLWINYREQFEKLDSYLTSWAFDFIVLNKPKITVNNYVAWLFSKDINMNKAFSFCEDIIIMEKSEKEVLQLEINEIEAISNYRITKSKFYCEETKALINDTIKEILTLFDRYFIKNSGKSILKVFEPNIVTTKNNAYTSAVYCLEPKSYSITHLPYTRHEPLKNFMANILRYSENLLRKESGYTGRLRGISLEKEYCDLADEYFRRKFSKKDSSEPKINIDMNRVKELEQESIEVIDLLAEPFIDDTKDKSVVSYEKPMDSPISTEVLEKKWDGLLTDIDQTVCLFNNLTFKETEIIKYLYDKKGECISEKLNKEFQSYFISSLIDDINIKASGAMGNFLIIQEDDKTLLEAEYMDELDYIFSNEMYIRNDFDSDSIPDEYSWLLKLSDVHKELISAILSSESTSSITEIANKYYSMPEILLDEINGLANDNIGDFLIDINSIPFSIIEEYETILREIFEKDEDKCQI